MTASDEGTREESGTERASGEEIFTLRILRSITAGSSHIDSARGNGVRGKKESNEGVTTPHLGSRHVYPPFRTLLPLSAAVRGARYSHRR